MSVFAQKVVISLIKSPLYHETNRKADLELKQYFSKSRPFKRNDIISIQSLRDAKIRYQFQIVKVEPNDLENFLIDNQHTSLVQTEASICSKWTWPPVNSCVLDTYTTSISQMVSFHRRHHETSETLPAILLLGPSGCGKRRVAEALCRKLNWHLCQINGISLAGESASAVEKRLELFMQQSLTYGPCLILIKSFHFLFKLKDINECNKRIVNFFFQLILRLKQQQQQQQNKSLAEFFVICTTSSKQLIEPIVTSNFNYELEIKNLTDEQRGEFLRLDENIAKSAKKEELDECIKKTSGLYFGEMQTLCQFLRQRLQNAKEEESSFPSLFRAAFAEFSQNRKFQQENKLNIESIQWSDVGGLGDIKKVITDTILLPLNYPSLFASSGKQLGVTRSGILLYGPPGTGKTLLAKAISHECGINFLSVKGPELLDMYVGQTEANVRALFEKARLNAPCVLFFDELDSLAPIRGRAGDSGGVMDRIVSQLLTEIDGLDKFKSEDSGEEKKIEQIFLIGATNRPDLIDTSLLRPGRFDKLIYVPIAKDNTERANVFKALLRKLPVDSNFQIEAFIEKCPTNLSGADFYAITNKARQIALKRLIKVYETTNGDAELKQEIRLTEADFVDSLNGFQPTLSEAAMIEYEKYFNKYSNKQQND